MMAFNFQGNPALAMGMGQSQGQMVGGPLMGGGMMGMMPGFPQMQLMDPQTQITGQMVNPGLNDAPLEFNTNKNKPPMAISSDIDERSVQKNGNLYKENERVEGVRRRDRPRLDKKERAIEIKDIEHGNGGGNGAEESSLEESGGGIGGEAGIMWGGMMGPPMPYQMMGMNPMQPMPIMDPNMMMGQFGMMGGVIGGDMGMVKEVIQLKSVTLIPPAPGTPAPFTRERPPGCKTIFVGGLAENTTEEIIREIFTRCGEMLTVRLSNKKFCHIRFLHEGSVDSALYFSGYRMRIENKSDAPNTGRLHVDFAQARDDQYEWECKQRQLQREARHRDRVEKERLRVPSPPPVPHYTEHEASVITERIKNESDAGDETFGKAVQVVITWLERGDCSKRNASAFYSMIQSTNSHIRRLLSEKAAHEEELQKARDLMKARMQSLLIQYAQIERVFVAASHKKVWDHFTKAQRKNIEMWKKQAAEIKAVELEEHLNTGAEDEMDVSDEDDPLKKKPRIDDKVNVLKEENDSLRCQLEAYKNEVEVVRHELRAELESTEAKLRLTQQTLQGMQQQLLEAKSKQSKEEMKVVQLKAQLASASSETKEKEEGQGTPQGACATEPPGLLQQPLDETQAKLIGLISMFLNVHPFGAGVDYVWSYLQKLEPNIRPSDIELLLTKFPSLFQQELSGIGANMERRWVITAFKDKRTSQEI